MVKLIRKEVHDALVTAGRPLVARDRSRRSDIILQENQCDGYMAGRDRLPMLRRSESQPLSQSRGADSKGFDGQKSQTGAQTGTERGKPSGSAASPPCCFASLSVSEKIHEEH
eukprot:scaffold270441_cov30-Prasinocladus_malaysianus.AAC.1